MTVGSTERSRRRQQRGRGDGTIFQRDNGTWCAQVSLPNGKRMSKTFDTRKEAQAWLVQTQKAQQDGMLVPAGKLTVKQFLDGWLEDVKVQKRDRTHQSYSDMIRLHLEPELGTIRLTELQPQHLQRLYRKLSKDLSKRTVYYVHSILHHALRRAVLQGLVPRNVADAVEVTSPRPTRGKPWTAEQARAFLDGVEGHRFAPIYRLALTTGMREGELLGLHWADVNLEQGELHVEHALQRIKGKGLVLVQPKTDQSRRTIALAESAVTALCEHQRRQAEEKHLVGSGWQETGFVFTTSRGTPVEPRNLIRHFKETVRRLALPDIRFHDLRYTVATLLLEEGVNPKDVQALLGHRSITVTLDIYSHVTPITRRRAANKMDQLPGPVERPDMVDDDKV